MRDHRKTKVQLIEELETMRQKVRDLEIRVSGLEKKTAQCIPVPPTPVQKDMRTHIEFVAGFDIIEARGLNVSDAGVCFETDEDLSFEMHFQVNGEVCYHRAHLVWLERVPDGGYRFGLMFARPAAYN